MLHNYNKSNQNQSMEKSRQLQTSLSQNYMTSSINDKSRPISMINQSYNTGVGVSMKIKHPQVSSDFFNKCNTPFEQSPYSKEKLMTNEIISGSINNNMDKKKCPIEGEFRKVISNIIGSSKDKEEYLDSFGKICSKLQDNLLNSIQQPNISGLKPQQQSAINHTHNKNISNIISCLKEHQQESEQYFDCVVSEFKMKENDILEIVDNYTKMIPKDNRMAFDEEFVSTINKLSTCIKEFMRVSKSNTKALVSSTDILTEQINNTKSMLLDLNLQMSTLFNKSASSKQSSQVHTKEKWMRDKISSTIEKTDHLLIVKMNLEKSIKSLDVNFFNFYDEAKVIFKKIKQLHSDTLADDKNVKLRGDSSMTNEQQQNPRPKSSAAFHNTSTNTRSKSPYSVLTTSGNNNFSNFAQNQETIQNTKTAIIKSRNTPSVNLNKSRNTNMSHMKDELNASGSLAGFSSSIGTNFNNIARVGTYNHINSNSVGKPNVLNISNKKARDSEASDNAYMAKAEELKSLNKILKDELHTLNENNVTLKCENAQLKSKVIELKRESASSANNITKKSAETSTSITNPSSTAIAMAEQSLDFINIFNTLQQALRNNSSNCTKLRSDFEKKMSDLGKLAKDIVQGGSVDDSKKLNDYEQVLKDTIDKHTKEKQSILFDMADLRDKLKKSEEDNSKINLQLNEQIQVFVNTVKSKEDIEAKYRDDVSLFKENEQKLRAEITKLKLSNQQQLNEAATQQLKDTQLNFGFNYDTIRDENKKLKDNIKQINDELKKISDQNAILRSSIQEAESTISDITRDKQEMEGLQNQISNELNKEKTNLLQKTNEIENLERINSNLEEQVAAFKNLVSKAESKNDQLALQLKEKDNFEAQLHLKEEENKAMKSDLAKLQALKLTHEKDIGILEKKVVDLHSMHQSLSQELRTNHEKQVAKLKEEIKDLKKSNQDLLNNKSSDDTQLREELATTQANNAKITEEFKEVYRILEVSGLADEHQIKNCTISEIITTLEQEIKNKLEEFECLEQKYLAEKEEREICQQEHHALKEASQKENDKVQKILSKNAQDLQSLKSELERKYSAGNDQSQAIKNLEESLRNKIEQIDSQTKEIERIEKQLSQANEKYNSMSSKLVELEKLKNSEIEIADKEKGLLSQKLTKIAEDSSKTKEECQKLSTKIKDAEKQIQLLNGKIQDIQTENSDLIEKNSHYQRVTDKFGNENSTKQNEIEQISLKLSGLEANEKKLLLQLKELKDLEKEASDLKSKLKEANENLERMRGNFETLEKEKFALSKSAKQLESELTTANFNLDQSKIKIEANNKVNMQVSQLISEVKIKDETINLQENSIRSLKAENSEAQQEILTLKKENEELIRECNELNLDISNKENEIQLLLTSKTEGEEKKNQHYEGQIESLKEKLKNDRESAKKAKGDADNEIKDLQTQLAENKEKLVNHANESQKEIKQLKDQIKTHKEKEKEAVGNDQKLKQTQSKADEMQELINKLENQIDTMKKAETELNCKILESSNSNKELSNSLQDSNEKLQKLELKSRDLESLNATLSQTVQDKKTKADLEIIELSKQLEHNKAKYESLIAKLEEKVKVLESEKEELKKENSQAIDQLIQEFQEKFMLNNRTDDISNVTNQHNNPNVVLNSNPNFTIGNIESNPNITAQSNFNQPNKEVCYEQEDLEEVEEGPVDYEKQYFMLRQEFQEGIIKYEDLLKKYEKSRKKIEKLKQELNSTNKNLNSYNNTQSRESLNFENNDIDNDRLSTLNNLRQENKDLIDNNNKLKELFEYCTAEIFNSIKDTAPELIEQEMADLDSKNSNNDVEFIEKSVEIFKKYLDQMNENISRLESENEQYQKIIDNYKATLESINKQGFASSPTSSPPVNSVSQGAVQGGGSKPGIIDMKNINKIDLNLKGMKDENLFKYNKTNTFGVFGNINNTQNDEDEEGDGQADGEEAMEYDDQDEHDNEHGRVNTELDDDSHHQNKYVGLDKGRLISNSNFSINDLVVNSNNDKGTGKNAQAKLFNIKRPEAFQMNTIQEQTSNNSNNSVPTSGLKLDNKNLKINISALNDKDKSHSGSNNTSLVNKDEVGTSGLMENINYFKGMYPFNNANALKTADIGEHYADEMINNSNEEQVQPFTSNFYMRFNNPEEYKIVLEKSWKEYKWLLMCDKEKSIDVNDNEAKFDICEYFWVPSEFITDEDQFLQLNMSPNLQKLKLSSTDSIAQKGNHILKELIEAQEDLQARYKLKEEEAEKLRDTMDKMIKSHAAKLQNTVTQDQYNILLSKLNSEQEKVEKLMQDLERFAISKINRAEKDTGIINTGSSKQNEGSSGMNAKNKLSRTAQEIPKSKGYLELLNNKDSINKEMNNSFNENLNTQSLKHVNNLEEDDTESLLQKTVSHLLFI